MRVRKKYLENGFKGFNQHEIMEMILFYGIQRRDTNPIAHDLINHFGNIANVLDASEEELAAFHLPENAIRLLRFLPRFAQKYLDDRNYNAYKRYNKETLLRKIFLLYSEEETLHTILILHNPKGIELFCGYLTEGWFNGDPEIIQKIVSLCLKYRAYSCSIAWKHSSGVAYPSEKELLDIALLRKAASKVDIRFNDLFIITDDNAYSLAEDPITNAFSY